MNTKLNSTLFFLLFLIFSTSSVQSQSTEARILEIRKMFAEVNSLHKQTSSSNCARGTRGRESDINPEGTRTYQKATRCSYAKGYSKVVYNKSGWEYNTSYEFYLKNGRIFFIYGVENGLCSTSEYRFYYTENGTLIKILDKTNNCDDILVSNNDEIRSSSKRTALLSTATENLRLAYQIAQ
ncbi:MAG: hypothetical protein ACK4V4_10380 [Sphingobacteriales bacterium]|jgi:hypothetical protein